MISYNIQILVYEEPNIRVGQYHLSHTDNKKIIALISADIVPSLDIEERELASVRRYPNEGQYSPISV